MAKRNNNNKGQLELLLPQLQFERSSAGITIRLKPSPEATLLEPAPEKSAIRITSAPQPSAAPESEPVRYDGIKIVNGRVIREGRHTDSEWKYSGLAGAMPRRIWDYAPDVVLERRADEDGIVRLLPIADTPGDPLADLEYVVVDVETTGAGFGRGHRITEVAIVHVNGKGHILDEYRTLVNPGRAIPAMITALTHIDNSMVRNAPRFHEVAPEIRERLEGKIFVAHNAGFDWSFISMELLRTLGAPLRGRMLCTVRMARKLVPELSRRSLDYLCYFFGVEIEARHRAYGDAAATADVFGRMLRRAQERDITGWNELQKLLYARGKPRKRRATPSFFDPSTLT